MQTTRTLLLLIIGIAGSGLSGCGGGVSDARKGELLRDLRSRTTAYKPVTDDVELVPAGPRPQISEPFVRVWSVQETVADALGRIGDDAVPALIKALTHPKAEVRVQATHALALIGSRAQPAVPGLSKLLTDENEEVRRGAARALGQIGPPASSAVPALLNLLELPPSHSSVPAASETAPAAEQTTPAPEQAAPAAGHASPGAG